MFMYTSVSTSTTVFVNLVVSMYMYMAVSMYVCIAVSTFMSLCADGFVYVCGCIYVCSCVCVNVCVRACVCVFVCTKVVLSSDSSSTLPGLHSNVEFYNVCSILFYLGVTLSYYIMSSLILQYYLIL